jgi:hypothetical protein
MPHDDPNEDEDWYEEDGADEPDDAEAGRCPECSGPVYEFTDKCPTCGYYLTAADRRHLWASDSKPKWILITATVILIVLVLGMLTLRF